MDLSVTKGDSMKTTIIVWDGEELFDLTGFTMTMIVCKNLDSPILIERDAIIANPATGEGVINLTTVDTLMDYGDYRFEVVIFNGVDKWTVVKDSTLTVTNSLK